MSLHFVIWLCPLPSPSFNPVDVSVHIAKIQAEICAKKLAADGRYYIDIRTEKFVRLSLKIID
jgi:hypothetical protein